MTAQQRLNRLCSKFCHAIAKMSFLSLSVCFILHICLSFFLHPHVFLSCMSNTLPCNCKTLFHFSISLCCSLFFLSKVLFILYICLYFFNIFFYLLFSLYLFILSLPLRLFLSISISVSLSCFSPTFISFLLSPSSPPLPSHAPKFSHV